MSALGKFEQFVENLIEKPFSWLLRGQLQPVEIAKRLARAMDAEQTLGVGKVLVPNEYHVALSQADFEHFAPMRLSLERELSDYLLGVARERKFTLLTRPVVTIETSDEAMDGQVHVSARFSDYAPAPTAVPINPEPEQHTQRIDAHAVARAVREVSPRAALVVLSGAMAGTSLYLTKSVTTLGRALDNDIVIEDRRVSRYHAEIKLKAGRFCLRDLHSSNGTLINGQYITEAVLRDGDTLTLGETDVVFQTREGQST